jgi:hypothetical protein
VAVAENQPEVWEKNRMTSELSNFAARLRGFIASSIPVAADVRRLDPNVERRTRNADLENEPPHVGCDEDFDALARELFALQFAHNTPYRRICEARGMSPKAVQHWTLISAVPTAAFKELDLTSLPPELRTHVFHSSGTTEQRTSRHFHSVESLAVYEASLWLWFKAHLLLRSRSSVPDGQSATANWRLAILAPRPAQAPHSSLVHMFETVRRRFGAADSIWVGRLSGDGSWTQDDAAVLRALSDAADSATPLVLLGTAFSFVHLLDFLVDRNLHFQLPPGSRLMETGGYKGRSRNLPKAELHTLVTERLGIPPPHIVCEYGMSELSSQAYDGVAGDEWRVTSDASTSRQASPVTRHFRFPPWARVQIISPETGREVSEGETGLLRVFDLANVFSVMAIQTEDVGTRRGEGFEMIGRAALSEPRGCSLMAV